MHATLPWAVSPEFQDALALATQRHLAHPQTAPSTPLQQESSDLDSFSFSRPSSSPIPQQYTLEVPNTDVPPSPGSVPRSASLMMKTRVAVRDKTPHRFQVVPLRDAATQNRDRDLKTGQLNSKQGAKPPAAWTRQLAALRPSGVGLGLTVPPSTQRPATPERGRERERTRSDVFGGQAPRRRGGGILRALQGGSPRRPMHAQGSPASDRKENYFRRNDENDDASPSRSRSRSPKKKPLMKRSASDLPEFPVRRRRGHADAYVTYTALDSGVGLGLELELGLASSSDSNNSSIFTATPTSLEDADTTITPATCKTAAARDYTTLSGAQIHSIIPAPGPVHDKDHNGRNATLQTIVTEHTHTQEKTEKNAASTTDTALPSHPSRVSLPGHAAAASLAAIAPNSSSSADSGSKAGEGDAFHARPREDRSASGNGSQRTGSSTVTVKRTGAHGRRHFKSPSLPVAIGAIPMHQLLASSAAPASAADDSTERNASASGKNSETQQTPVPVRCRKRTNTLSALSATHARADTHSDTKEKTREKEKRYGVYTPPGKFGLGFEMGVDVGAGVGVVPEPATMEGCDAAPRIASTYSLGALLAAYGYDYGTGTYDSLPSVYSQESFKEDSAHGCSARKSCGSARRATRGPSCVGDVGMGLGTTTRPLRVVVRPPVPVTAPALPPSTVRLSLGHAGKGGHAHGGGHGYWGMEGYGEGAAHSIVVQLLREVEEAIGEWV